MFKKILIANRGEIAVRVMRTAKRLGIATVAVYSDADRDAMHVAFADEAVHIGPSPSAQSYLVIDHIIQACRDTGADAVHPGYGFLSENSAFAEALEKAGIIFVGPGTHAINVMGDKITSKKLADKAGVSTVPGYSDVIRDTDHAVSLAADIGYPVMLKASAGGGGKGMRIARNVDECREGFERARSEAASSFGDDRVFIEKFVEEPRHIEIQVLADTHGNVIHLGERECSIQRRHQKVIEEAPSPFVDEKTREAMGAQAVALAKAVDYRSAGTVEFIVDRDRNFYFLEMNTRLQVEHPVTEIVTGLDLVEQMFRVAAGEQLGISQADVRLEGWAMESRIYAEDPARGFLPSIGRLVRYSEPEGDAVRVDSGVTEGGEISMFYDPMIAKLVTSGSSRNEAIAEMSRALNHYLVRGVTTNLGFLQALMNHPRFIEGRLSTGFIAEEYGDEFVAPEPAAAERRALVIAAAVMHRIETERLATLSGQDRSVEPEHEFSVGIGDDQISVTCTGGHGRWEINGAGETAVVDTDWRPGLAQFRAEIDGTPWVCAQTRSRIRRTLETSGAHVSCTVIPARLATLSTHMIEKIPPDMSKLLVSPMPGLLVSVAVQAGQSVKAGEELAVVEAMKMENVLRAERDATVEGVHADPGDSLTVDQTIISFE